MKEIPLTQGKVALVDDEDYPELSRFKWQYLGAGKGYAKHAIRGGSAILMHRQILGASPGQVVDHVDGNPLNNQRANLRLASNRANRWNSALRSDNRTGFKGVRPRPGGRFYVQIYVSGKCHHLGTFATAIEAAKAYDTAAQEHFGPFARLNFPGT